MRDDCGVVQHVTASFDGRLDVLQHGGIRVRLLEKEVQG